MLQNGVPGRCERRGMGEEGQGGGGRKGRGEAKKVGT